jgi:hypothetical protein
MNASSLKSIWALILVSCCMFAAGTSAIADPLYTVTDLGPGGIALSNDASGAGVVIGGSGQAYSYTPTSNSLPTGVNTANVPDLISAPVGSPETYGNPGYAYSDSVLHAMNRDGIAAGIDTFGIDGHTGDSAAFYVQQQPDGSWGTPHYLWSGLSTFAPGRQPAGIQILGVSDTDQILGIGSSSDHISTTSYLYDIKSGTTTNLSSIVNGPTWALGHAIGIDEQGRLLVDASELPQGPEHTLLLTPAGLSSDPVPVPEPTTLATLAVAAGGMVVRSYLKRS